MKTSVIILILVSFFISINIVYSQNEYNNWYFGVGAGITFNTPNKDPKPLNDGKLFTKEGCSSISDSLGNLLFYTDGITVWNREHEIMKNGSGLKGHYSSTQSALIVPYPNNPRKYYLFTTPYEGHGSAYYSIIDFTNNDLGEIVEKNITLMGSSTEKITSIQHSNKIDYWIVTIFYVPSYDYLKSYRVFLLDKNGISPVVNPIGPKITMISPVGHLKASPDSKILVNINQPLGSSESIRYLPRIEFFSFDNNTGQIGKDLYITFNNGFSIYGGEFSPDSKKFYALFYGYDKGKQLIQFDLSRLNSITYKIIKISNYESTIAMQLAPDGKIYFIHPTNKFELSRISKPNEDLDNCDIEFHTTNVYGKANEGLPNCIASFLLPGIEYYGADTICLGDTIRISTKLADYYLNPTIRWTGPNGFTSDAEEIYILNAEEKHTGYYVATVYSENRPQYRDSIYIHVSSDALPPPVIETEGEIEFCQGDSLQLTVSEYFAIEWSTGEKSRSIYVKEAGIYGVRVENASGCYSYSEIEVFVKDSLQPVIIGENSFCEGDSVILRTAIEYDEYTWSTGDTSSAIVVKKAGGYFVEVSNEEGCRGTSEIFNVTENPLPEPVIEGNKAVCLGANEKYRVTKSAQDRINWELNAGGEIVGSPYSEEVTINWTELGTWELYVSIKNEFGCIGYETIQINVEETVKPEIITSNPKLCPGTTLTLTADQDYDTYTWHSENWSDTRTGKQIEIDETGNYILEVTQNSCIGSDTIKIEAGEPVVVEITGDDKICIGRRVKLSADRDYASYEWSTGENTKEIMITEAGKYTLKVTNDDGCEAEAETEVNEIEVDLRFVDDNILDFGEIELGDRITKTISIKNNSDYELEYTARIEVNSQITITPNSAKIGYNETKEIELLFEPDYPRIYSDKLIIDVTEPCNLTIEKEISGIGYLNSKVWIENTTVYPDTRDYQIPINTRVTTDYPITLDLSYQARIITDASLIEPDIGYTLSGSDMIFDISGSHTLSRQQNTIEDISGWIVFAEAKNTPIRIDEFLWTSNEYVRITAEDGNIKIDDICFENLLHIEAFQPTIFSVSPLPASDKLDISITSQERGRFNLTLISIEGIELMRRTWQQSKYLETKEIDIDLTNISSGSYIIILRSPYGMISKQINVVK